MDKERKLAHIVAYYLSRFDKEALAYLGFKTDKEAFQRIAEALGLLPNYIKFRRDEFDVAHPHRKGWHKRPMTLSIINTIYALQEINEPTLRNIVQDILSRDLKSGISEDLEPLTLIIPEEKSKKNKQKRLYVPRNITGRKSEEIFMDWFSKNKEIFSTTKDLIDMRDYGCGYDFQIVISDKQVYGIEVKGVSEDIGGVLITGKEWETACAMRADYYLVFVSNICSDPVIKIVNNPYEKLLPQRYLQTVIQINWAISFKEVSQILEKNKV